MRNFFIALMMLSILLLIDYLLLYVLPLRITWGLVGVAGVIDIQIMTLWFVISYASGLSAKMTKLRMSYEKISLSHEDIVDESEIVNVIFSIISTFSDETDVDVVLETIADAVRKLLKIKDIIIKVYKREENKFFSEIVKGRGEINLGEKIMEDVCLHRKSHLINQLSSFAGYDILIKQGFQTLIAAPLSIKGESIGIVAALTDYPHEFIDKDLRLLTIVAGMSSLIVENAMLMDKTKKLSITDGLTNIFNYRHFQDQLEKEILKAKQNNIPLTILMGDVDYFKMYNDMNGHQKGDEALRQIAAILRNSTKGTDMVARYGGEEFVVVLPNTIKKNAHLVAENLRRKVQEYKFENEEAQPSGDLTLTFGIASYPEDGKDAKELIGVADKALYLGKEKGKNIVISSEMGK